MPSKLSITATFLFVYFLCDSPAVALERHELACITGFSPTSFTPTYNTYTEAYFITEPTNKLYTYSDTVNTVDIISCDPATTNGCTEPKLITLQCTKDGWDEIGTKTVSCRDGYFLNKDDFKCYKCSSVTGNNNAIVNKTNPTNTAKDCYIPSNNQLENDRGFFNYDTSCYYASTGLNNATGFTPWWESA